MRIAILSPHFRPHPGGVSDYTYELAKQFKQVGHEVIVITSSVGPFPEDAGKILTVPHWGIWQAFKINRVLKNLKAEQNIIQWTPLAFAPKTYGIAPGLLLLLLLTRSLKRILFVHESHYPVLFDLKGLCIGLPHFFQFIKMVFFMFMGGDQIIFSHKGNEEKWRVYLPFAAKLMSTIAVFSNIPPDPQKPSSHSTDNSSEADNKGDGVLTLGYFGGLHPTNDVELVRQAFNHCQKSLGENVTLKVIGLNKETAPKAFQGKGIELLGRLSEEDVSLVLKSIDLLVIPFTDGVSTRRGTLMAGLSHKVAIATTSSYNTCDDVPWEDIVAIRDSKDSQAFCEMVLFLLGNPLERENLAQKGREYYQQNFSVEVSARKLLIES
jgi:glycosyltransferase involved in cell wall biosynthesis